MAAPVARLKRRREFLRVASEGRKAVTQGMVVQALRREDGHGPVRVGFTASRKVGRAVARNRARRRLKALAAALLPVHGAPATDYVLIARRETPTRRFASLGDDLRRALARLAPRRRGPGSAP